MVWRTLMWIDRLSPTHFCGETYNTLNFPQNSTSSDNQWHVKNYSGSLLVPLQWTCQPTPFRCLISRSFLWNVHLMHQVLLCSTRSLVKVLSLVFWWRLAHLLMRYVPPHDSRCRWMFGYLLFRYYRGCSQYYYYYYYHHHSLHSTAHESLAIPWIRVPIFVIWYNNIRPHNAIWIPPSSTVPMLVPTNQMFAFHYCWYSVLGP